MATVQGYISVTDLVDGVVGTAVIFTNENHTFVADADGAVSASELAMFSNNIDVEAGMVDITYAPGSADTLAANNTFTIPSVAAGGGATYRILSNPSIDTGNDADTPDLEIRLEVVSGMLELTVVDDNTAGVTGFVDPSSDITSLIITIPVIVRTQFGTTTYNRTISLSKALGGSAPYVRMTSTDQSVEYNYLSATPKTGQADITMNALSFNTPASVGTGANSGRWFQSINGTDYTEVANTEAGVTITGQDSDNSSLTVTTTAYNTHLLGARRVIYRYVRGTAVNLVANHAVFDQISIFRVDDSESGYSSYVEVGAGTTAFKNGVAYNALNAATYADLVIRVRGADGVEITTANATGITYRWSKNGVDIPGAGEGTGDDALAVDQGTGATDTNLSTGYGVDTQRIRIASADVEDNGADVFGCQVDFTFTG